MTWVLAMIYPDCHEDGFAWETIEKDKRTADIRVDKQLNGGPMRAVGKKR